MDQLVNGLEGVSSATLVGLGVLVVVELTLMVAALVSLVRRPASAVRGPKWLWALVVVFVNTIGPILYFALGRAPESVDVAPPTGVTTSERADSVADVLYGGNPPTATPDAGSAGTLAGERPPGDAS